MTFVLTTKLKNMQIFIALLIIIDATWPFGVILSERPCRHYVVQTKICFRLAAGGWKVPNEDTNEEVLHTSGNGN